MKRKGFTLIELLVVLLIIALVSVVAIPAIVDALSDRSLTDGAQIVQAAIVSARDRAILADAPAGVRLVPNEDLAKIVRLADGTVDPARPLAYSRIVPLTTPAPYASGRASVRTDGWPAGFVPAYGRLVFEESIVDGVGLRCEPTAWFWTVRVGEVVQFLGRSYTITGPMLLGPADGNVECFVNWGPPGAKSPLVRYTDPKTGKDLPSEWLYLCDRRDNNRDGWIDPGHDGIDNDLDGLVDEDDEWSEVEAYQGVPDEGLIAQAYSIARRPVARPDLAASELPAGVVVDATGWASFPAWHDAAPWTDRAGAAHSTPGWDYTTLRSRLPVNLLTGAVDLLIEGDGQVYPQSIYARPAPMPLDATCLHLWIGRTADLAAASGGSAKIVSIVRATGRTVSGDADPADPAAAYATAEGRGN